MTLWGSILSLTFIESIVIVGVLLICSVCFAMTPERWNKIKELFTSAHDRPEYERAEFLMSACGTDEELRSEAQKLLDSFDEDDAFLQNSAVAEVASMFEGQSTAGMGRAASVPPRLEAGQVLNERYEIIRLLGRGGMGEVYLAIDTRINRNVALKVLHTDLVSSKENLSRFAREAQTVSALNHPHIMTIYEFDTTEAGTRYFVAEYIDGQTLNRLVKETLQPDKALDIAIQVSSALSAAHEAGIIHRDIKPENIMVRRDGYVKVLDFGLAKLTQRQTSSTNSGSEDPTRASIRTTPGSVMGTAAYMSPEQARGLHVDARTDIWSLGAVIYEMLTGHRPFSGETPSDTIASVLLKEPPSMSSYVQDLPAELHTLVSKALAKDVVIRYQTSDELRADLERVKKLIEFDENLRQTARYDDRAKVVDQVRSTVEYTSPTTDDAARWTNGGNQPGGPPSLRSLLSVSGLFHQAQTHSVRFAFVALVFLAMVSAAINFVFVAPGSSRGIDSIAVLPFENASGDQDLTYVAEGISEGLIDRLAQLPQLKVISRNSSFRFRGGDIDLRGIATQLGVRAILTGSVVQVGEDLVIRFDVVDAADDRHLAGGQYRRKSGDIVNIQNEIAQAVAENLQVKLTDSQSKRLTDKGTENSEAFRYYLSGLVELNGPQDVRGKALEYFERAIALDPDFAAAHTEIAWVYWVRANGSSDPNVLMPKAKVATERALELNPDLAKARALRAMLYEYEFDWSNAELEYKRAIELSPNLDFARNNHAFFLSVMGRQTDALAEVEEQRIRDPINQRLGLLQKGIVLTQARRFDDALEAFSEAQALEPVREIPNFAVGYAYAGKGLYSEAAGYYRKSVAALGGEEKYSQPLVYLAATYAKMPGKQSEARAILKRIEATDQYASPALLATVYSALDDNDKAMDLLEQAYIQRDLLLRFIGTGYEYDGLRGDSRFINLTKRIGLAQ